MAPFCFLGPNRGIGGGETLMNIFFMYVKPYTY
jgi:hypothetical protein